MIRLSVLSILTLSFCAFEMPDNVVKGSPVINQQKSSSLKIEPYTFETADGQKVEAELGRLFVPENRGKPQSKLIELAFVRFKSTAKNPGAPIVYLAGGPGGSGINTARGSRFALFMAMRQFSDVIALDQRGTGMSKPSLGCRETLDLPTDKSPTRDELLRFIRDRSRNCAQYWQDQGVDLSGYNTNESADDLEDLRKALGVEKISLWSISYGTHLALTTIRRHQRSIHKAILAGIEGPDHTLKLPSNVQQYFVDLDRLVKSDPIIGKEIPDLLGLMKTVLERLEREPVAVELTDPKTKQKVKVIINKFVMQYFTATTIGTEATAIYPAVYYAASKGDYSLVASYWLQRVAKSRIDSAMTYMMDCSSGASMERRQRIRREAKLTLMEDFANADIPDVCDAWGNPDLGAEFRSPVEASVPVLFISGTLDARTPVSNAEEYRKGFRNSQHLIIEGAWHSDPLFLSSPQIKDVMLEFMGDKPLSTTRITLPAVKFHPLVVPLKVEGIN
ncbi:MAG: alpha/beta hydrolase [Acidobacteriota bacterium]